MTDELADLIEKCGRRQYFNLRGWKNNEAGDWKWEACTYRLDMKNLVSTWGLSPKEALEKLVDLLPTTA